MAELNNSKETLQEAMALLLENYWIIRDDQPEQYNLLRQNENVLRAYFLEKCGWRLIQTPQFYKLEKIPAQPASWMGLQQFQHQRDYALLCCLLAVLEEKSIDDQFLLSELCESLMAVYPQELENAERLSWENYDHRRSLVRVLTTAVDLGIMRLVDGDSEQFAQHADSEALYEVTALARYFLRTYPKDLQQYTTLAELQSAELFDEEASTGLGRRARVYRQLLLTPAYHSADARPEDFLYLRNMHRRLREELESYTGWQFELYKDCALLTSSERTGCGQIFPFHQSGLHAVILHLARLWRDKVTSGSAWPDSLSPVEFERLLAKCRTLYGSGWTKEYRELSMPKLADNVLQELVAWNMAATDKDTGFIILRPLLVRLVGQYPDDYVPKQAAE